jgi:hypothetical protein
LTLQAPSGRLAATQSFTAEFAFYLTTGAKGFALLFRLLAYLTVAAGRNIEFESSQATRTALGLSMYAFPFL